MAVKKSTRIKISKEKNSTLKENIIQLLKDKGNYEITDDTLIDELIFNYIMVEEAKKNILKDGIMVNVIRDKSKEPLYQLNQSVGAYHAALKYITTIYTKLGISPSERKKLKISSEKTLDIMSEFDDE